jgi:hypothetical protein
MGSRRLLAAVSVATFVCGAGPVWARCNSVSISVDGTVEPSVPDAVVRVDILPAAPEGADSVLVRPDASGRFTASLWYSTSIRGPVGSLFGDDCSRKPKEMVLSLQARDRTLATEHRSFPGQFVVDVLGNYRAKSPVSLRRDGTPESKQTF